MKTEQQIRARIEELERRIHALRYRIGSARGRLPASPQVVALSNRVDELRRVLDDGAGDGIDDQIA